MIRRRLTLTHAGRTFLDRWGLCHERIGGFYLHHIAGPDPGFDLHDHPWAFVRIILWGGYTEQYADTREAVQLAFIADRARSPFCTPGVERKVKRVSRFGLHIAHRITSAKPHTWTLVLRGPTRRSWGFYLPDGWLRWDRYPYRTRRPVDVAGR